MVFDVSFLLFYCLILFIYNVLLQQMRFVALTLLWSGQYNYITNVYLYIGTLHSKCTRLVLVMLPIIYYRPLTTLRQATAAHASRSHYTTHELGLLYNL